jgi:acetoin utilization deacetylase AcuC-like enzyme
MTLAAVVHHPAYEAPLPAGHRFPMGKYGALARLLTQENLLGARGFVRPALATEQDLGAAHASDYVRAVLAACVPSEIERRIGLPVTPEIAARAAAACGGTLLAARLASREGCAINAAGGSHHAQRDFGAGFCVFNDVAVAASVLLANQEVERVLIIDLDVHQGDGTAAIFAEDPRVITASMHCEKNFPTRKIPSDHDVALPQGADGPTYLAALSRLLETLSAGPRADMIFYNAGVDVHQDDALGYLRLTDADIAARDAMVLRAAHSHATPIACVLGGGYGADAAAVAARHLHLFRAAKMAFG